MDKLLPLGGALAGSALLPELAPWLATTINESALVGGGVGGLINPVTTQGVGSALGIVGGIGGATGGSALNASLEGVLKGGEEGPKLPMPIPNFVDRGGKGGVLVASPNAASMMVPIKPSTTVGMRVGSQEDLLRRLFRGT